MNLLQSEKIKVETLSPLLIGQESEPAGFSYVCQNDKVFRINFDGFIESIKYPEEKNVLDIIVKNLLISTSKAQKNTEGDLRKILHNTGKVEDILKFVTYAIENHSSEKVRLMSDVLITAKISDKPYIPGSSLKGAVNTALVSYSKVSGLRQSFQKQRDLDYELKPDLGSNFGFRDSASSTKDCLFFSNVGIFTLTGGGAKSYVFSKELGSVKTISELVFKSQQPAAFFCEAVKPQTKFESELLFRKTNFKEEILEAVISKNSFVVDSELKFFNKIKKTTGIDEDSIIRLIDFYENLRDLLEKEELILRVGHGSGFKSTSSLYCKAIDGKENLIDFALPKEAPRNRKPIKRDRDRDMKVKSRLLVNFKKEYLPFGWIKIDLCG
ncbi:MAG: type III-A CRISPR-associated RAMP protein Csm5 [Candidatus Diapherotrites archaeon]|nr:type III-A CRISPR-associated RAMP protein Csm5 [Candidatus Diapherotrites archaeon]